MIITAETLHKHIEILRKAKQQGSLAIFVGCGVSRATSKKYKTWSELIDELKKDLNLDKENDFLKVAQLYSLEFGSIQEKRKVQDFFPEIDEPGEIQKALVNLKPHYIITTNWDCLIDNAIDDNPGIIDKIATDSELVQSDKDKKYLKIHGDFLHDNFVFTEDDYLNYSYNFPLIENFIKSILSTHVVLLLGYSFSDWDLKQIVSWIRHNSKERPPIYMIEKKGYSNVNAKYYDNLGIQILPIFEDYDSDYEKEIIGLFKKIDGGKNIFSENEPEKIIYSMLAHLEKYPLLLHEIICKTLTNSSVIFDSNNRAILELNVSIETKDRNDEIRNIFQKFYDNVDSYVEQKNEYYYKILNIFKKADIHGFATDKIIFENNSYFNFDNSNDEIYIYENKEINFDFSSEESESLSLGKQLQLVYDLYYSSQYEKAFSYVKQLIRKSRQERNYFINLISLFNYNVILQHLKYSFSVNPEISKKYKKYEFVNLENEYDSLPEGEKLYVKEIYNFLNFSFLYKKSFSSSNNLTEIQRRKHILAQGGLSFSSDIPGHISRLKNLTEFVLNNYILIDEYKEYRNLCRNYLLLSIENTFNQNINFDKYEIYNSIKCFAHKDIKEFYESFYNVQDPEKKLNVNAETINWFIDTVFTNCIDLCITNSNSFDQSDEYCQNCLFMLSLLHLSKEQTDKILKLVIKLVADGNNSQGIFENINSFIGIQYNIFKNKTINSALVLSILETLLLKFVSGKINGHEHFVLTQSKISNIFGLSKISDVFFTNKELLIKVIYSIKTADIKDQIIWVQHVLVPIYQVSDGKCQEIIKNYVSESEFTKFSGDSDAELDFYIMKLLFIAANIEDANFEITEKIKNCLNNYPKNKFSSKILNLQSMINSVCIVHANFKELKDFVDNYVNKKRQLLPSNSYKDKK